MNFKQTLEKAKENNIEAYRLVASSEAADPHVGISSKVFTNSSQVDLTPAVNPSLYASANAKSICSKMFIIVYS